MAAKLLRKKNADPAESLLPYTNKGRLIKKTTTHSFIRFYGLIYCKSASTRSVRDQ